MTLRFVITLFVMLLPLNLWADDDELADGAELKVEQVKRHELIGKVNGKRVTVRLMGVHCETKRSTKVVKSLIRGKVVILHSDKSFLPILKDHQDRYVAYVETSKGADLGHSLVKTGACSVGSWKISHPKQTLYASAE